MLKLLRNILSSIIVWHDLFRSPMNGGLHIKQELMNQDHHMSREPEPIQNVIKREIVSDYDDLEHNQHNESVAEDLTIASDHTESNMLDA